MDYKVVYKVGNKIVYTSLNNFSSIENAEKYANAVFPHTGEIYIMQKIVTIDRNTKTKMYHEKTT